MPIEYPQVIVAIKEWIGKNKIQTESTVTVAGQPGARRATLGEFLMAAVADAFGAVTGGNGLLPGDALNGAGEVVPGALRSTITGIADQVKGIVDTVGTSVTDTWNSIGGEIFSNPLGDSTELMQAKGAAILDIYSNADLSAEVKQGVSDLILKAQPAGVWDTALTNFKQFTNELSGVAIPGTEGFTVSDAVTAATDKTNAVLSQITTIQKFDIKDLAGSLVNTEISNTFNQKLDDLRALAFKPNVTKEEVAAKTAEVDAAAEAMNAQVAADKANYAKYLAQQQALDAIVGAGLEINAINNNPDLTDQHKELLTSIYNPVTLANAQNVANLKAAMDAAATVQVTV